MMQLLLLLLLLLLLVLLLLLLLLLLVLTPSLKCVPQPCTAGAEEAGRRGPRPEHGGRVVGAPPDRYIGSVLLPLTHFLK